MEARRYDEALTQIGKLAPRVRARPFERALLEQPGLRGKLVVEWTIGTAGERGLFARTTCYRC